MKAIIGLALAMTMIAVPAGAAGDRQNAGIWIIENYYGEVAVAGAEVGRKIFYCDGRIEIEGTVTDNAYLEYVNDC